MSENAGEGQRRLELIGCCQNSMVGAAEYGQSVGARSVGVSDVRMQGSKTRLKHMCFALTTGTGVSLYFRGLE